MPELLVECDILTTSIFTHISTCICTENITFFVLNTVVIAKFGFGGVGSITNALLG